MKENIFRWSIGIFSTMFSVFLFLIYISEFINVAFLKEIENYPFGCECVSKFSYRTEIHYSIVTLLYSIFFLMISIGSIRSIIRKKIKITLIAFILLVIIFITQFYI